MVVLAERQQYQSSGCLAASLLAGGWWDLEILEENGIST